MKNTLKVLALAAATALPSPVMAEELGYFAATLIMSAGVYCPNFIIPKAIIAKAPRLTRQEEADAKSLIPNFLKMYDDHPREFCAVAQSLVVQETQH